MTSENVTYTALTEEELKLNLHCHIHWNLPKRLGRDIKKATHFKITKGTCIGGNYEHREPVCSNCVPVSILSSTSKIVDLPAQEDTVAASGEAK